MSETFDYEFSQGTKTDAITVTVSTPAVDSLGFGPGYSVTAISGTVGARAIGGEVGDGGALQTDASGVAYDNTVFTADAYGDPNSPSPGSSYGIDTDGLDFTAGSDDYDLFSLDGSFFLEDTTTGTTSQLSLVSTTAPCYCPGTLIRTPHGDVPVETLAIGDHVVTASGEATPVRWIGRRSYAGRFLQRNPDVMPVCVHAGALGDNLPARDLYVSPLHAMLLDGVLIPAGLLVNGVSVTRVRSAERVDYIHVELGRHEIIFAEGAPSESFVDDNSRDLFQNAHEFASRYPGHRPAAPSYCAPRVEDGPVLAAAQAYIDRRARQSAPAQRKTA